MYIPKIIFVLLFFIPIFISLRLKKLTNKFKPIPYNQELSQDEISETLSDLALKRLYSRLSVFNNTSCKITAKFVLLAISGIEEKADLPNITLTGMNEYDLFQIHEKLMNNYVIQIEIRANHHFVIFKKNSKEMYLLHGFQDLITINEWMNNTEIMKPYLTIEEFFDKFSRMLNFDTPKEEREQLILDIFLPSFFTKNQTRIDGMLKWFGGRPVTLININYVPYQFNENQNLKDFKTRFDIVDYTYLI
jgi:hypothetical protein